MIYPPAVRVHAILGTSYDKMVPIKVVAEGNWLGLVLESFIS
jgi:hypothetical protein